MLIRPIQPTDLAAVHALLLQAGWEHRAADLQRLDDLVARSAVALVAVDEPAGAPEVVGFVRALTDGIANGYLSMLAVAESHRRRGIGSALVRACMGPDPQMTWVLRAGRPGLTGFYERLGFRVSTVAMERPRQPLGSA